MGVYSYHFTLVILFFYLDIVQLLWHKKRYINKGDLTWHSKPFLGPSFLESKLGPNLGTDANLKDCEMVMSDSFLTSDLWPSPSVFQERNRPFDPFNLQTLENSLMDMIGTNHDKGKHHPAAGPPMTIADIIWRNHFAG